ncbi:dephospho-CoA kinase [Jiulongibacter sediminis]|uniref:dephospho-CoA kinase n=1 Tax=Jiulongibacter sediminis TaxID=1605367 RepID=UPI0026F1D605|nr:dephospho-CoA kinase [Jiulongibacter sediminis]
MIKVGITGGIGSGKSTVARIFEVLDIPVYHADDEAKWLIANDKSLKIEIIKLLGEEAYINGEYNRSYVSLKVFNDSDLLQRLNSLVHPAVAMHFENWVKSKTTPYIIKEAAIVKSKSGIDHLIYVHASSEKRVERTLKRDNFRTREAVLKIIESQQTEDDFRALADFVIDNESDLLIPQVLEIHKKFISF